MSTIFTNKGNSEKILLKLWKQCQNEEMCDVVLLVGDEKKRIPAHRTILSAASEFFERMFSSAMLESISKEVKFPSANGDILQSIVEYIYTGHIAITKDTVVDLLKIAHMLLLSDVVAACGDFMIEQLHSSNSLGFLLLAEFYECEVLSGKAKDFSLKNFMQIRIESEFLKLNAKQLIRLLDSDDLCVDSEEDVFNSLLKWLEHERLEREQHKAELLKVVRMPLLDRSFLTEHVEPICNSPECREIYMEAIEWHLTPQINVFSENKFTKPRRSDQILMGITVSNKMFINYYCPQGNIWMKWSRELEYRVGYGVAVMESDLFIIGGYDIKNNVLNTVICLNLKTMTLKKITTMHEHRAHCRAAILEGFVYVVGGKNATNVLSSVEKFDPKTNKWVLVASMSVDRANIGIGALPQKLYVIGGYAYGTKLSSAECYDPIQNVWQSIASMGKSRQLPGIAIANGLLYAIGGHQIKTVERYDPQTNKWSVMCSLSQEMHKFNFIFSDRCTTLRDKVVLCYNDHIEVYNSATNEWKKIVSFKSLNINSIFSYSDKLLTSEFIEN